MRDMEIKARIDCKIEEADGKVEISHKTGR